MSISGNMINNILLQQQQSAIDIAVLTLTVLIHINASLVICVLCNYNTSSAWMESGW